MIGFVNGEIEDIYEDRVLLDCGFMGYNIFVPGNTLGQLTVGEEIKLYTYLSVREDAMQLFGFASKDELKIFKLLITVNGIGPKGALAILTIMSPNELRYAVATDDSKQISKAQGVGAKTAQKVIIELKDKLDIDSIDVDAGISSMENVAGSVNMQNADDAIEVLVTLGYSLSAAKKAVNDSHITEDMSTEDIIKIALKNI